MKRTPQFIETAVIMPPRGSCGSYKWHVRSFFTSLTEASLTSAGVSVLFAGGPVPHAQLSSGHLWSRIFAWDVLKDM